MTCIKSVRDRPRRLSHWPFDEARRAVNNAIGADRKRVALQLSDWIPKVVTTPQNCWTHITGTDGEKAEAATHIVCKVDATSHIRKVKLVKRLMLHPR